MMQSPAFHGAMADSPLPAVSLSPCQTEEKKAAKVAAVSSPASPPFGLRAAVAAAIATFPERRRGLKDVSNSLAPAKSPAPKPQPSPSPVRAVSTLRSSGAFSPAGASPRTTRESVGSASEFSETGSDTPLHTERAVEPTTPKTPVASPAAPLLMTPPPRSPKLDAPFSELGKFPELAPAAPPAPARRVPVTLAALVVFVALGAAVVVTAPPPVAPVVPVAPAAAPAVTRKAIVLRAQTAALKPVPKVKPAAPKAPPKAMPKKQATKPAPPKATAPKQATPKAKKPAPAAAKQPRKGPLARALAPAHALVKAILALALPVKVAFCAAAAALAILA